jgi:hypothetical protein
MSAAELISLLTNAVWENQPGEVRHLMGLGARLDKMPTQEQDRFILKLLDRGYSHRDGQWRADCDVPREERETHCQNKATLAHEAGFSMAPARLLSRLSTGPESMGVMLSPLADAWRFEGVATKWWLEVDVGDGWISKNHNNMRPLRWARKNGLGNAVLKEGLEQVFLEMTRHEGHYLGNVGISYMYRNKRFDKLVALCVEVGVDLAHIPDPHLRIVTSALARSASDTSLALLSQMGMKLDDPTSEPLLFSLIGRKALPGADTLKLLADLAGEAGPGVRESFLTRANTKGLPMSHTAARALNVPLLELVIGAGADVHEKDKSGNTLFHSMARRFSQKLQKEIAGVMAYLGEQGIDWLALNKQGKTGLMIMAKHGSAEQIIAALRHEPALFSLTDKKGLGLSDVLAGRDVNVVSRVEQTGFELTFGAQAETPSDQPSAPRRRL